MKKFLWLLVILIVIAGGTTGAKRYFDANSTPDYRTVVVKRGDIEKTVTALGSLQPREYVDVGTQVSGQLKKVHVEIGDEVKPGQLIAEIDPAVYQSRVQSSEANLERLKAQLLQRQAEAELARRQLERNRRLHEANAMSLDVVEENEARLKVAEAQVRALRAEIKAAESTLQENITNLGYTKIYSPLAGTVVSESAVEGQTVNASQSAPTIVQVANLDIMTVWAEVAEADIVKVKPGMKAYFTTLGMPERRWHGEVRQVQPTPEIVNDVVLYKVLIDVDNSERLLMKDMTVQVFFLLDEARDVVVAPLSALKPAGDGVYTAQVLGAQGPQEREVRIGLANRSEAEILSGLEVGDKLIVGTVQAGGSRQNARGRRPF